VAFSAGRLAIGVGISAAAGQGDYVVADMAEYFATGITYLATKFVAPQYPLTSRAVLGGAGATTAPSARRLGLCRFAGFAAAPAVADQRAAVRPAA
jgi:hypothetical protein